VKAGSDEEIGDRKAFQLSNRAQWTLNNYRRYQDNWTGGYSFLNYRSDPRIKVPAGYDPSCQSQGSDLNQRTDLESSTLGEVRSVVY
jgi:hypothetical protein